MNNSHLFTQKQLTELLDALGGDCFKEQALTSFVRVYSDEISALTFVVKIQKLVHDLVVSGTIIEELATRVIMRLCDQNFMPESVPKKYAQAVYNLIREVYQL
jgi:hypothetical protein